MATHFRLRLYLLAAVVFAGFSLLTMRLYKIQIVEGQKYENKLPGGSEVSVRIPGVRGEIKDRNGITLVQNVANYEVNLDLKEIVSNYKKNHKSIPKYTFFPIVRGQPQERKEIDVVEIVKQSVLPALAELGLAADFNSAQLRRHYRTTSGLVPYTYRRDLKFEEFAVFAEHNLDVPGVTVSAKASRDYRYDSLASHILGYVNLPDIKLVPLEEQKKYNHYVGDDYGVYGIEKTMNHYLQGKAGKRVLERDEKRKIVGEASYTAPQPGADVYLTIDARIQMIAERSLRKIGRGAAVVVDPQTGDILAMASVPSFNPNAFIPTITLKDWKHYTEDPSSPMFNRAINPYSPGSTFKVPISLSGMLSGSHHRNFTCYGGVQYGAKYMKCWSLSKGFTHGSINVSEALKFSCNAFFYQYANACGIQDVLKMTSILGLGHKTGIEVTGESPGSVPGPEWLRMQGLMWSDAFTALASIGQGANEATPLQMASVTATVSNGGRVFQPRLIDKVAERDGKIVSQEAPKVKHDLLKEGLTREDVETVKRGMWRVVNESRGTAPRAKSEITVISGKTGTTQTGNPKEPTNAWFIAFAPYDKPEIAVCVFVHNGFSGGRAASPIAKNIIDETMAMRKGKRIKLERLPEAEGNFDRILMVSFDSEGLEEYASDDSDESVDVSGIMPVQLTARKIVKKKAPAPSIKRKADAEGSVEKQNSKRKQRWKNLRRFIGGGRRS
ncbi:MAG: penicillin-binding protein 2 [Verrucomicrobiales bacterium]|nr:penicillin-binding protein 2 [Verrucomicrobiales bacterium]